MKTFDILLLLALQFPLAASAQSGKKPAAPPSTQVRLANGVLEGITATSGIREFKGVPFAAPPVGKLRWQPPQPVTKWTGVRSAKAFGPRAMQLPLYGDMNFRSNGVSENCLYLNVWTPAKTVQERRPVLVYFYGGGFNAGDGSEPRYDGESMARQGIVAVTVNYRLGVFGFFTHPALTQESPHHASGNYGLLDQQAALRWVQQNIAAFGGDPAQVTIGGESAGSVSVSAQLASPGSRNTFQRAIGESGSLLSADRGPAPLAEGEQAGVAFAAQLGAASLDALRALPAQQLLEAAGKPEAPRFRPVIDGLLFTKAPLATYAAGEQAKVPLLVGWNSQEVEHHSLLGQAPPTLENYRAAVEKLYGPRTAEALQRYPAATDAEVAAVATDLATDRFTAYATWKWAELHGQTSQQPVYRYLYARPRPAMTPEMGNATAGLAGGVVQQAASAPKAPPATGAVHSAEIEYALGNLATNKVYAWTPADYQLSKTMQAYFVNFIKSGNPNGAGLPTWPATNRPPAVQILRLDLTTQAMPEPHRARYEFLDQPISK
ncbi:carboxylesterase/lipase family protein [Hymenobacter negativus]|uniref:Carboxylic ester hydrolase n=1 Tax=Hymenobacter negativus TaxID=2795026 RepID=A0ABS3QJA6_9BACT|nr:carboxylesterase family protein [Hymenobacter negativus]MBO2011336.1 carboxylesterase family protein [Hymenobacter negativus]